MTNPKVPVSGSESTEPYRIPASVKVYPHFNFNNYADQKVNITKKLTNILYRTDYCLLCFECNKQTTNIEEQVCIINSGSESYLTLREIIKQVFLEKFQVFESSNGICNNCQEIATEAFNFITTTYHTAVAINSHLDRLKMELDAMNINNKTNNIILTITDSQGKGAKSEADNIKICAKNSETLNIKSETKEHILCHNSTQPRSNKTGPSGNFTSIVPDDESENSNLQAGINHGQNILSPDCDFIETSNDYMVYNGGKHSQLSFNCKVCHKTFYGESSLSDHELLCGEQICQFCDLEFKGSIPQDHLISCSKSLKIFQCDKCPASFELQNEIIDHTLKRHTEGDTCDIGLFEPTSLSELEAHIKINTENRKPKIPPEKLYKKKDPKQFANGKTCKSPENKQDNKTKSGHVTPLCDCCGRTFPSTSALQKHIEKRESTTTCHLCGKTVKEITFKSHLWRHNQIEKDPDFASKYRLKRKLKYRCSHCDYTSNSSKYMESHTNRFHLKIKPYKCTLCAKNFSGPHLLKIHTATHENTSEFACSMCDKVFLYHLGLKLHLRSVHTGDKPYKCSECKDRFISSSLLSVHRRKVHSNTVVECPICRNMFPGISDVRRHIKRIHWNGTGLFDIRDVDGLSLDEMEKFDDRRSSSYGKL